MESAVGTNKINYLKEQNELYKEQVQLQRELEEALKSQQATYKNYLQGKGFNFNSDGNLTNYEEKLIAMKKEENPIPWEITDPKPPVVRSGHLEDRKQ